LISINLSCTMVKVHHAHSHPFCLCSTNPTEGSQALLAATGTGPSTANQAAADAFCV